MKLSKKVASDIAYKIFKTANDKTKYYYDNKFHSNRKMLTYKEALDITTRLKTTSMAQILKALNIIEIAAEEAATNKEGLLKRPETITIITTKKPTTKKTTKKKEETE